MPFYHRLGQIPNKRHTQFRKADGTLYAEELMGTNGFAGISSLLYHHRPPTAVQKVIGSWAVDVALEKQGALSHRHFRTWDCQVKGDAITGRFMIAKNDDVSLGVAVVSDAMPYFYRNGEGDELLFVHTGKGRLETIFGVIDYRPGDYLVIPVGTTYRLIPADGNTRLFVLETRSSLFPPKRYRNEFGQLLEHSPYCERDIRVPQQLLTFDEKGEYELRVRKAGRITAYLYTHHPFDVIGWDGYLYPYAFNIEDFEPITGRIHQPPPVHQTFEGKNVVVCSFVPRKFDYHPLAIPAPYNHSNIHSDEVIYYVDGNFMSRKGVGIGSLTLHPGGIAHGPHPGTVEASIGKEETKELAVMVDTFYPLAVTEAAHRIEDQAYMYSWRPE
jgi:homogentisate 1,2-dioxygenase